MALQLEFDLTDHLLSVGYNMSDISFCSNRWSLSNFMQLKVPKNSPNHDKLLILT